MIQINNHVIHQDGRRGHVLALRDDPYTGEPHVRVLWDGWAHPIWVKPELLTVDSSTFDAYHEIQRQQDGE